MIRKPNFKLNWKYALGEIALIFIGISLAIAFQNWNDKRIELKEVKAYLDKISTNVKADLENLQELKTFRDSTKMGCTQFVNLSRQATADSTEILSYFDNFGDHLAVYDVFFNPNRSGFEALKGAGYLNKLQSTEVEAQLFSYYLQVDVIEDQEVSLNSFVESMETEMFKENVVQRLIPLLERRLSHKNDAKLAHELLKNPAFVGTNIRLSRVNTMGILYDRILATGDSLLVAINNFNQ